MSERLHNFHLNIPIFNKLQTTRFLILSNNCSRTENKFRMHTRIFGRSQLGITLENNTDFGVLLTVHLSIILVIYQLNAQILVL